MGSNQKATRQRQKETLEQKLAGRKAALAEKGIAGQEIRKDPLVKSIQADIKRTIQAIASIDSRNRIIEKAKATKQQNAANKAASPKSKKQKTEPAPPAKKTKKKKSADKGSS